MAAAAPGALPSAIAQTQMASPASTGRGGRGGGVTGRRMSKKAKGAAEQGAESQEMIEQKVQDIIRKVQETAAKEQSTMETIAGTPSSALKASRGMRGQPGKRATRGRPPRNPKQRVPASSTISIQQDIVRPAMMFASAGLVPVDPSQVSASATVRSSGHHIDDIIDCVAKASAPDGNSSVAAAGAQLIYPNRFVAAVVENDRKRPCSVPAFSVESLIRPSSASNYPKVSSALPRVDTSKIERRPSTGSATSERTTSIENFDIEGENSSGDGDGPILTMTTEVSLLTVINNAT